MIIKDIQLTRDNKTAVLSARCKIRKIGWDTIYFKVDAKFADYLYSDASPFAAALLIPSMRRGEDLIVQGSISKKMYNGMKATMREVLQWEIGLKPIEIRVDKLVADPHQPKHTASFFSGGVDSFYTFLKHKKDRNTSHRVDSFIFVNNSFDIDPRNERLWKVTLNNIRKIAQSENIELVVVESNINSHELLAPIVTWDYIHGACLAAAGLALRKRFGRVYVPSTHSVEEQIPWGSNLALDNNWSTETITFLHDGSEATRLDKVVLQIAHSPTALKHLRVCYKNTAGAYNCGKCDKCLRTMVNLYIAGALDKAQTFPRNLDLALIANTPTIDEEHGGPIFHRENLTALQKRKTDPDLQEAITASIEGTTVSKTGHFEKLMSGVVRMDHAYIGGYLFAILSALFGKTFSN